jgi:hypothetical protein
MPTWGELDQQFKELVPALRRHRIFYVWGDEDVTELRGYGFENERRRFEALAQIAGLKLSEVPAAEINPRRADPPARTRPMDEAPRWHSGLFRKSGGGQSVVAGIKQPPTRVGS